MRYLDLSKKTWLAILVSSIGELLLGGNAVADNPESVTAQVTFVEPIGVSEVNALQYGFLEQTLADLDVVVIAPDSSVADTASRVVGGLQSAAFLTVTAAPSHAITIVVGSITSGTGYVLGTFVCSYDGGIDTACDDGAYSEISVASATLLIGATLTGDGLAVTGTANGSFSVTVSYQ